MRHLTRTSPRSIVTLRSQISPRMTREPPNLRARSDRIYRCAAGRRSGCYACARRRAGPWQALAGAGTRGRRVHAPAAVSASAPCAPQAGSARGDSDLISEPGGPVAAEPCPPAPPRDRDDLGDEPRLDIDLPDGGERDRD